MSNKAFTQIILETDDKNILVDLRKKLLLAKSDSESNNSFWPKEFFSEKQILGRDIASEMVSISDIESVTDDEYYLILSTLDNWGAKKHLIKLFEENYDVTTYYCTTESGCGLFQMDDPERKHFDFNYYYDHYCDLEREKSENKKNYDLLGKITKLVKSKTSELLDFNQSIKLLQGKGYEVETFDDFVNVIELLEEDGNFITIDKYENV